MKTLSSILKPHSGKAIENKHISDVHYSENEFFYEGQENRTEDEVQTSENKKNRKKQDRFWGDFNLFL